MGGFEGGEDLELSLSSASSMRGEMGWGGRLFSSMGCIVVFKLSAVGKRLFFGGHPFFLRVCLYWYLLE